MYVSYVYIILYLFISIYIWYIHTNHAKSGDTEPDKLFDCNSPKDERGVLLDTSMAFKEAWHEGLIFKLKTKYWAKIDYALGKLFKNQKKGCPEWFFFFWKINTGRGSTGINDLNVADAEIIRILDQIDFGYACSAPPIYLLSLL